MKTARVARCAVLAMLLGVASALLGAQQDTGSGIRIGDNDLGGVVTSANGAEAGVRS